MNIYTDLEDNALQKLAVNGDSYAEEELVSRYMRLVRVCARPLFLAGGERRSYPGGNVRSAFGCKAV